MRNRNRRVLCAILATVATACSGENAPPADQRPSMDSPEDRTAAPSAAVTEPAAPDAWVVSATAAGPVEFGMMPDDFRAALGEPGDSATIGSGCEYVAAETAPDSLLFMFEGQRLVRVDVVGGPTPTVQGARVGDSEADVESLYPNLRRLPHKYEPGAFYLVALPKAPADTLHRVVFETDGEAITRYRAGVFPQVAYVEGCG